MGGLLTIGMAHFRDGDGVWMTLQSLQAHHPTVEYLVIDNAPEPDVRAMNVTQAVGGRYLHRPDLAGTAPPRDALFRLARTPWVCCVDSHVLLEPGAVQALLEYAEANPESRDLVQGPMVHDDGRGVSTHWRQEHPPGLWGTWDRDERGVTQGVPDLLTAVRAVQDDPAFREPDKAKWGTRTRNSRGLGERCWEELLKAIPDAAPFDIPMQGLGLFAMRTAAWPGFNPYFRGFGGEEGYVHEKVRRLGGRCLCLPALRWRHKFRHMEHGAPPPPYRLAREDHVWNLLVGHRELGVDCVPLVREKFGGGLPAGVFEALAQGSERVQPFGKITVRKRLKLLGVWYTNCEAPPPLLQKSLGTIKRAVDETMHHDVMVTTSAWTPVDGNPFPCVLGRPQVQGHAAILAQVQAAVREAGDYPWEGICFLEHDVLYPPDYFDRMGDALATGAPVAANDDYEGVNATGFLRVRERHQPMHEIAMRRDVALANLARAEADCKRQGWAYLEPDHEGDRSKWARIPPQGLMPSLHVNW